MRKHHAELSLSFFLMVLGLTSLVRAQDRSPAEAQNRWAYEGVVNWKKSTIGTAILLDKSSGALSGWIRLDKTFFPIEDASATDDGYSFRANGNAYRIDQRRNRIIYSGPDGSGDRLLIPLTRLTGVLKELLEETRESGKIARMDINGRMWDLQYGRPSLWKRSGPPFDRFERLDELLGKELSVWVADADLRRGTMVVIEEPTGMDIPLKAPKKPKDDKAKN